MQNLKLKTCIEMQFKTANLSNTRNEKVSIKFYKHNACKDLEKEIHSLCWYDSINPIFKSMGIGFCLGPLFQEISSLTVVLMKSFLSVKS